MPKKHPIIILIMKVIVICEFSGRVREAFTARGHDAWSCDILPTEIESKKHLQCPIQDVDKDFLNSFDIAICHPPCTHLAVSGAWRFKDKQLEQTEALDFVRYLMDLPINKIAVENPKSIISTHIRKPDQIIQPYQFGEDASKTTCLWLKNLPKLVGTKYVEPRLVELNGKVYKRWANQTDSGQNKLGPSLTREKERGKTYRGIAQAMAEQWG